MDCFNGKKHYLDKQVIHTISVPSAKPSPNHELELEFQTYMTTHADPIRMRLATRRALDLESVVIRGLGRVCWLEVRDAEGVLVVSQYAWTSGSKREGDGDTQRGLP